jgi:hypothetical protein
MLQRLLLNGAKRTHSNILTCNDGTKGADSTASASVHDTGGRAVTFASSATTLRGRLAVASLALSCGIHAATLAASLRSERAAIAALTIALAGRRPGLALALSTLGVPGRVSAASPLTAAGSLSLLGLGGVIGAAGNIAEGVLDVVGTHDSIRGFMELSVKLTLSPVLHFHQQLYRVGARGVDKEVSSEASLAELTCRGLPRLAVSKERRPDANGLVESCKLPGPHVVPPARRGLPRRCRCPRWDEAGLVKKVAIAFLSKPDPSFLGVRSTVGPEPAMLDLAPKELLNGIPFRFLLRTSAVSGFSLLLRHPRRISCHRTVVEEAPGLGIQKGPERRGGVSSSGRQGASPTTARGRTRRVRRGIAAGTRALTIIILIHRGINPDILRR